MSHLGHCRRRSVSSRRKRGVIQSTPADGGRVVERELIQCCHCQFTKSFEVGDELRWGLCMQCMDWHCPKVGCRTKCVPIKRWLENKARGRPDDFVPVVVSVPCEVPGGG